MGAVVVNHPRGVSAEAVVVVVRGAVGGCGLQGVCRREIGELPHEGFGEEGVVGVPHVGVALLLHCCHPNSVRACTSWEVRVKRQVEAQWCCS